MNKKAFVLVVLIILLSASAVSAWSWNPATWISRAFKIGDAKDIDLNGQGIGNGYLHNVTCDGTTCSGFTNGSVIFPNAIANASRNESYTYFIWNESNKVYAKNGSTGLVEFSNTDINSILTSVVTKSNIHVSMRGNFTAASTFINNQPGLVIDGNGITNISYLNDWAWQISAPNVQIKNMYINLNQVASQPIRFRAGGNNGVVDNVLFMHSTSGVTMGVGINGANDITLSNIQSTDLHDYLVAINTANRIKVLNCKVLDSQGIIGINDGTNDSIVTGCTMNITEDTTIGIKLSASNRTEAYGNVMNFTSANTNTDGFSIGGGAQFGGNNVYGNTIINATRGINLNNHMSGNYISNNYIYNSSTGIVGFNGAENVSYLDNIIDICNIGLDVNLLYKDAVGNQISNCQIGIFIENSSKGGTVSLNNIQSTKTPVLMYYRPSEFPITMFGNYNFKTEAFGNASVSNGSTITHGMAKEPVYCSLTPSNQSHQTSLLSKTATTIQVGLYNATANSSISVAETVYWKCGWG